VFGLILSTVACPVGNVLRATSTAATPIHLLSDGSIISRAAEDSVARWRMVKASQTPTGNRKTATIGFGLRMTGSMFPTTP
jgi:hypothetical protein